ncbi:MAG: DUF924 family protein [Pseudomonadota bacterium]
MSTAEPLLEFWFGSLSDGFADDDHRARWFGGGNTFDEDCRASFASLAEDAADGRLTDWLDTPRSCLAFILLTDQIPRNIHRGSALAFAADGAALNAARVAIEAGFDRSLGYDERCFLYLPFEHSENLINQHTCVGLFTALRDETPPGARHLTGNYLRHAQQHRDIIRRFGRFPHRNAVLGRASTSEELAYLETASGFGQAP